MKTRPRSAADSTPYAAREREVAAPHGQPAAKRFRKQAKSRTFRTGGVTEASQVAYLSEDFNESVTFKLEDDSATLYLSDDPSVKLTGITEIITQLCVCAARGGANRRSDRIVAMTMAPLKPVDEAAAAGSIVEPKPVPTASPLSDSAPKRRVWVVGLVVVTSISALTLCTLFVLRTMFDLKTASLTWTGTALAFTLTGGAAVYIVVFRTFLSAFGVIVKLLATLLAVALFAMPFTGLKVLNLLEASRRDLAAAKLRQESMLQALERALFSADKYKSLSSDVTVSASNLNEYLAHSDLEGQFNKSLLLLNHQNAWTQNYVPDRELWSRIRVLKAEAELSENRTTLAKIKAMEFAIAKFHDRNGRNPSLTEGHFESEGHSAGLANPYTTATSIAPLGLQRSSDGWAYDESKGKVYVVVPNDTPVPALLKDKAVRPAATNWLWPRGLFNPSKPADQTPESKQTAPPGE